MTGFHLDVVVLIIALTVVAWDGFRRHLKDRAEARVLEAEAVREAADLRMTEATQLGPKVDEMLAYLTQRQKVSEQALSQFITQAQELIGTVEARRVEAEKKALRNGFQR